MELYLDTSDVATVKVLSRIFPLAGVTANPGIIVAGKKPLEVVLPQFYEAMGDQGCLFAQVMTTTVEGVVNDAHKLCSIIADIVVKVLVTTERLVATKTLETEGIPTSGTTVYGAVQRLLSTLASAEHVALYVNRTDTQGGNGIQTVTDLHQLLKIHTPQVGVLATSPKTPRQVLDYLLAGGKSITLSLDVAQQMISCLVVDAVMAKFEQDRRGVFGKASI